MRPLVLLPFLLLASCVSWEGDPQPTPGLENSFKNTGSRVPPPQGSWWKIYQDRKLTRLIALAEKQSQSLQAALARHEQARALLDFNRVDRRPTVNGEGYARRQQDSGNTNFSAGTFNDYKMVLDLSWELDLWGKIRRTVAASAADAEAAKYEMEAVALSLRADLVRTYLSLRYLDAELALLGETGELRREARRLMQARFKGGASSRIDYERAAREDEEVRSELAQLRAERARFENALAVLTGQSASGFQLKPNGRRPFIPEVPSAAPSALLRRRPDVAAAERRLEAARERVGLSIVQTYPSISITGEGGVQALRSSDLFDAGSKIWNIGPEVTIPFVQWGRGKANTANAAGIYKEALANYRDTLLRAVEETENALGDTKMLAEAASARKRGSASSATIAVLARKRYQAGVTDYFEVVEAERDSLEGQRTSLTLARERTLATASLVEALGGGWER